MTILIQNGTIVDPASGTHQVQDLWIENGSVSLPEDHPDQVIDASGKIVCPGFLDIHMHEDPVDAAGHLEAYDESSVFACMLHMGVTTAVAGNCGENKYHPADYLDLVDRDGAPVNVAMLAGHGFFRQMVGCTDRYAPADANQRARMAGEIREALERGCVGVSYGIRYEPGMDARELTETAVQESLLRPMSGTTRGKSSPQRGNFLTPVSRWIRPCRFPISGAWPALDRWPASSS